MIDHMIDRSCDTNASSNGNALNDPNTLRYCDWSGSIYQNLGQIKGIPYRNEFKLQTNVPIRWGVEASASLYSNPVYTNFSTPAVGSLAGADGDLAGFQTVTWSISSTTKYPANCNCPNPGGVVDPGLAQGAESVVLVAPGSRLGPRLNQVDVNFRKKFRIREKYTIQGELGIFNLFNTNTVLSQGMSLGSSVTPFLAGGPGGTPTTIENPRMFRANMQVHF